MTILGLADEHRWLRLRLTYHGHGEWTCSVDARIGNASVVVTHAEGRNPEVAINALAKKLSGQNITSTGPYRHKLTVPVLEFEEDERDWWE